MPSFSPNTPSHRWRFYRAGGLDQVHFRSGADLLHLDALDQKLWVALSCPTKGLEFDPVTLSLIDADGDGRIRVHEVLSAVKWACARLKDPSVLLAGNEALPLAAIDDTRPEGRQVLASSRQILKALGKADATSITPADTADPVRVFGQSPFNGDGVLRADAVGDPAARQLVEDIVATLGGVPDRCGAAGVDQATVESFFKEVASYLAWVDGAQAASLPLGEGTASASEALAAVQAKVDDFFARCRLAAFDPRAAALLNRAESEYAALAARDLSVLGAEVASLPLAQVGAGRALPLGSGINPAWADAIAALRDRVVTPILGAGRTELTQNEWSAIRAKMAPFAARLSSKPATKVEKLGVDRLRAIQSGQARAGVEALIREDLALAPEMAGIDAVDRLVRYHRDLVRLLNNFVAFTDFYAPDRQAIFQSGTLYLDSRSCDLCIRVDDPAAHAGLASLSKIYIAYCDLRRPSGQTMKIAACFTQGDADFLMVGRNGIFYDRQGRDWDATITRIIDNPISIRQAFWAPYKKFLRMIEEQVAKRAAAADAAADAKLAGAATAAAHADKAPVAPPPPKKFDVGIVAAIGVAISGLISALTLILGYVFGLKLWQYPLVVLGLVFVVSGPSMLIAWLKLRQRTLGPVLDANGWAVNGRVRINIPLGTALTQRARLPVGAEHSLEDPYEDKSAARNRRRVLSVLVFAAILTAAYLTRTHWWKPLFGSDLPSWIAPAAEAPAQPEPAAPAPAK